MTAEFLFITFTLFLAGMTAGIALGPVLHWVGVDVIGLQHFTEFGVVMMLFLIGLEMQPKVVWAMRARIFVMGGLQVGVTPIGVMAVAMVLGQPWTVSLAIGLIFALSSTAIVTQTLNEKGLMRSDGGQTWFPGPVVSGYCGDPDAGSDSALGAARADQGPESRR